MSTQSAIQSCLRVFLPDSTTFFISFTSDSSVSISFVLALKKSSLYPPPYALASASQPPGTKSAVQDFHAVSRAASTPRTSFWQSFLKALLMSSPLTFFIHAALAFEVLLYFHHPLSSPHASTTTGLQHVDQGK